MTKLCECGCGRATKLARQTQPKYGHVKGRPLRFLKGHYRGGRPTHGKCGARVYVVWKGMVQRCTNPKNPSYKNYGARGVTICQRWLTFENFYADMGDSPRGMTLERRKNSRGYSKLNCVWADHKTQQRNLRNNHWFTFEGRKVLIGDVASSVGISYSTLYARIKRGMTLDQAVAHKTWARTA